MSFFAPQNPGIGGIDELTNAEEIFLVTLAGLAYANGDLLYYNGGSIQRLPKGTDGEVLTLVAGLPSWEPASGGPGSASWGGITGTLSDQTDLQTALNAKANTSHTHAIADVTGLQTALDGKASSLGADDNYVTDAEKVKLANLSGTNTGDQVIPDQLSDLTDDSTHRLVTDAEKTTWNSKAAGTHTHAISDVTGLQTALDNKLDDTQFSGLTKITVGTSAPGSPATGDLWVDTN